MIILMHTVQWNLYPEELQILYLQQDSVNKIGKNVKRLNKKKSKSRISVNGLVARKPGCLIGNVNERKHLLLNWPQSF